MFISNLCRHRLSFYDDCLSLKIPVVNCYKCYAQEIVKAQRKRMGVKDGYNSAKFFVVTHGGQCTGGPHKGMHVKWVKVRIDLTGSGGRAGNKKEHGLHGGVFGTPHLQITSFYLVDDDYYGVAKKGDGKDAIVMNEIDDLKRIWPQADFVLDYDWEAKLVPKPKGTSKLGHILQNQGKRRAVTFGSVKRMFFAHWGMTKRGQDDNEKFDWYHSRKLV